MTADDLFFTTTRPSAALISTLYKKWVRTFHEGGDGVNVSTRRQRMKGIASVLLFLFILIHHVKSCDANLEAWMSGWQMTADERASHASVIWNRFLPQWMWTKGLPHPQNNTVHEDVMTWKRLLVAICEVNLPVINRFQGLVIGVGGGLNTCSGFFKSCWTNSKVIGDTIWLMRCLCNALKTL